MTGLDPQLQRIVRLLGAQRDGGMVFGGKEDLEEKLPVINRAVKRGLLTVILDKGLGGTGDYYVDLTSAGRREAGLDPEQDILDIFRTGVKAISLGLARIISRRP